MRSLKKNKKTFVIAGLVIVAALVVFDIFMVRSQHKIIQNHDPKFATASPEQKADGSQNAAQQPGSNETSPNNPSDKNPQAPNPTGTEPTSPTGTFVSNSRPNLSGHPAPNQVQSTCNTSPGASCKIVFTKGSEQKSLATQTADPGGAAYWTWTLQEIGLTEGTWQVSAVASNSAGSKTVVSPLKLEVSP